MSKSGIYLITNTSTGLKYVGQAKDVDKRINQHINNLKKNKHHNELMQEDFNNGDEFNLKVIEYTDNLDERETYWIDEYNTVRIGYNKNRGRGNKKINSNRTDNYNYKDLSIHRKRNNKIKQQKLKEKGRKKDYIKPKIKKKRKKIQPIPKTNNTKKSDFNFVWADEKKINQKTKKSDKSLEIIKNENIKSLKRHDEIGKLLDKYNYSLSKVLKDFDNNVNKLETIKILSFYGDKKYINRFIKATEDEDLEVRKIAFNCLEKWGYKYTPKEKTKKSDFNFLCADEKKSDENKVKVDSTKKSDFNVDGYIDTFGKLSLKSECNNSNTISDFDKLVKEFNNPNNKYKISTLVKLQMLKDKKAIPCFIKATSDKNPKMRYMAIESLNQLKYYDKIIIFEKGLYDEDYEIQKLCIEILNNINTEKSKNILSNYYKNRDLIFYGNDSTIGINKYKMNEFIKEYFYHLIIILICSIFVLLGILL